MILTEQLDVLVRRLDIAPSKLKISQKEATATVLTGSLIFIILLEKGNFLMTLKRKINILMAVLTLLCLLGSNIAQDLLPQWLYHPIHPADVVQAAGSAEIYLPEGNDYATRILGVPWDMSEFSDISQGLNNSGQSNQLKNILVQNGLFSATAIQPYSQVFALWPGFRGGIEIGKIGQNYPIDTSIYNCAYFAMKSDQLEAKPQIFWYQDDRLNINSSLFGYSRYKELYYTPYGLNVPVNTWRLIKIGLTDPVEEQWMGNVKWDQRATWQGLALDPVNVVNENIVVDWIRLTDCASVNTTISWTGGSGYLWLIPQGTNRSILIDHKSKTSPYALDVQGVQPGTYNYKVTATLDPNTATLSGGTGVIHINKTSIATFDRPSFYSGPDYAAENGKPWDFTDSSSVTSILNTASYSFQGGILDFITHSGILGVVHSDPDAQIKLATPIVTTNSAYRYLSFRMNTVDDFANVPHGMMARWIWTIQSKNPATPANECHLVSQDIPYDVGWHIYSIDLSDAFDGSVEETTDSLAIDCPALPTSWNATGPSKKFRFDPNENITGEDMHQQIDWIRLTKPDQVEQGNNLPIRIMLNKPADQITFLNYYYTDNPNDPSHYKPALEYVPANYLPGTSTVFLPLVVKVKQTDPFSGITYLWDTDGVARGNYYICVSMDDGYNSNTNCSDAFVTVK